MRPIHKSKHARPPRRTFDGGWQQETFLRAAMIRAFPKNATIERGIFVTKDSIPRWSRSAVQHKASSIFVPLQTFVKFDMSFGYQPTLLISEMLHEKNVPIYVKTWHLKCFGFEICSTPWNLPSKLESRRRIVHVARYYFWIEREQENILLSKRYLKYYFVPLLSPTWIEIEFRRGFSHGGRKNSGVSVAGGGVTIALKTENLRGISEQHRFTFGLYD